MTRLIYVLVYLHWTKIGFPTFICEQSELQQIEFRRGTQQFFARDQLSTSDPVRKSIDSVWAVWSAFKGSTYPKASNFSGLSELAG